LATQAALDFLFQLTGGFSSGLYNTRQRERYPPAGIGLNFLLAQLFNAEDINCQFIKGTNEIGSVLLK
jgi:hypothetical protein